MRHFLHSARRVAGRDRRVACATQDGEVGELGAKFFVNVAGDAGALLLERELMAQPKDLFLTPDHEAH